MIKMRHPAVGMRRLVLASLFFLAACAPAANPTPTPQVITIHASPATQPWLSEAFICAQEIQVILSNTNDLAEAEIDIRMGEPPDLKKLAFEIGRDDLLIVTHRESPVQNLTLEQARALFSEPGTTVQIQVFATGEDIQQVFNREIMLGATLTSQARLALGPQQMSDTLNNDQNLVGILPRRWKAGTVREVFSLPDVPILALTQAEPQSGVKELIGCLQKRPAP